MTRQQIASFYWPLKLFKLLVLFWKKKKSWTLCSMNVPPSISIFQKKCQPLWPISSNTFPTRSYVGAVVSSTHLTPPLLFSSQQATRPRTHHHGPHLRTLQSFHLLLLLLVYPRKRRSLSLILRTSPFTFAVEKTWLWASFLSLSFFLLSADIVLTKYLYM